MKTYDIIVIGSGGGTKISTPAAALGYKVAMIEKGPLGGTCLNRGCIPSKMLIHPANIASDIAESSKFGLQSRLDGIRFSELVQRVNDTIHADSENIRKAYDAHPNIDLYPDECRFVSDRVIEVSGQEITAKKIFIAAGARPMIPPIEGLSDTPFMTSAEALKNTRQPRKMIIIGAGYIGAELGHFYGALGTEIHVLARSSMLGREDTDVTSEFQRVFSKRYKVHFGVNPIKVNYNNEMFTIIVESGDHKKMELSADALLVATGVQPNTDILELKNTAIKLDEKGFIRVDDHLRTTVADVWALGDCIGRYLFRHAVNFEGEYLFRTVIEKPSDEAIAYPPMPHAIFSYPEVGSVGATEQELKTSGRDFVIGTNSYRDSAKGMALLSDYGFCKLLFDRSTRKLLGAHIVGPEASDMIHTPIAFMNMGATVDDMLRTIYIHPALPEIVRNAARKARALLAWSRA